MQSYESGYGYEPEQKTGAYLTLKSKGDKVRVRIVSWPIRFEGEYQGKKTTRFAWAVINRVPVVKDGKRTGWEDEATTFRGGTLIYTAVRSLLNDPEWGDPSGYDIEIERTEGKQSYYTVTPKPNGKPLSEAEKALFAEHGWSDAPDWANPWLEKLYLKGSESTGGREADDEYDPFSDE